MAWACTLPEELSVIPRGLVCLANLDTRHQPVHRSIWELLDKERENAALRYRLVDVDEQYPRSKSKRPTYEWYVPKGILKTNWMHKHLHLVPSLVVIFFELDWNDPAFKEKQNELKAKIDTIRANLEGHATTISVVLLQSSSCPPVDDAYSSERDQLANTLCTYFEINKRSLCVLPVLPKPDNLSVWIDRLEQTFIETSQNYYNNEVRRVKKHKETLNNITHQLLHIRHQFKIGFFYELRRDIQSAVKSYKSAYSYLTESARMHDTNILEMKMVAGFLTYKICRILFDVSQPVEAINHFRRHADIFKMRQGPQELVFEHKAWLSKQFQTFADLFTRCPFAIQTQHPGFYYQEAAYQSMARKQLAQTTCQRLENPDLDTSEFLKGTEFYGQRPWRQHHQSIEITDAQKEREAIAALRDAESHVNHSELIISLLVQAITHFKNHASNRMKLYLMYSLAEEYASSKDYDQALNYYTHIVQAYRAEQWWPILQEILPSALRCAYLSVKRQEWIQFSLELLNPHIQLPLTVKNKIQADLGNFITKNHPPQFDSTVELKDQQWKSLVNKDPILVDADFIRGLLECKINFTQEAVSMDNEIHLKIAIKADFPSAIQFHRLSVSFNLKEYDGSADINQSDRLIFSSNEYRIFDFHLKPKVDHVQRTLEVISVFLTYGDNSSAQIVFHWRSGTNISPSAQPTCLAPRWRMKAGEIFWNNLPVQRKTNIIMRPAAIQLNVEHQLPVLLYESYPMKIRIKNCENVDIHSASLSCTCSMSDEGTQSSEDTYLSFSVKNVDNDLMKHACSIVFETVAKDAEIEQDFFVRCNNDRPRDVNIRLAYHRQGVHCMKEINAQLHVVNPFSIQYQTIGMRMEPLTILHAQEPFMLMIDTKCTSSIPITIVRTNFKPSQFVVSECAIESQITDAHLKQSEVMTEGFALRTQPIAAPVVHNFLMGEYSLFWRRSSHSNIPELCTTFSLADFNIEQQSVFIEVTLPNYVSLQQPFEINYRIHNRSNNVHEYKVTLEQINLIVAVTGSTVTSLLVPPHSSSDVTYKLIATVCGFVQLPKLKLSFIHPQTQDIDESIEKSLPTHVFVIPSNVDSQ